MQSSPSLSSWALSSDWGLTSCIWRSNTTAERAQAISERRGGKAAAARGARRRHRRPLARRPHLGSGSAHAEARIPGANYHLNVPLSDRHHLASMQPCSMPAASWCPRNQKLRSARGAECIRLLTCCAMARASAIRSTSPVCCAIGAGGVAAANCCTGLAGSGLGGVVGAACTAGESAAAGDARSGGAMLNGGRGLDAVLAGDTAASQWTAVCCRGDGAALSSGGASVRCPTCAVVAAGTASASAAGESAAGAAGCAVVVAAACASSRTCSRLAMMSTFLTFACRSCTVVKLLALSACGIASSERSSIICTFCRQGLGRSLLSRRAEALVSRACLLSMHYTLPSVHTLVPASFASFCSSTRFAFCRCAVASARGRARRASIPAGNGPIDLEECCTQLQQQQCAAREMSGCITDSEPTKQLCQVAGAEAVILQLYNPRQLQF